MGLCGVTEEGVALGIQNQPLAIVSDGREHLMIEGLLYVRPLSVALNVKGAVLLEK